MYLSDRKILCRYDAVDQCTERYVTLIVVESYIPATKI